MIEQTSYTHEFVKYTTSDGSEFESLRLAEQYEHTCDLVKPNKPLWIVYHKHNPDKIELFSTEELAELSLKYTNGDRYVIQPININSRFIADKHSSDRRYPEFDWIIK